MFASAFMKIQIAEDRLVGRVWELGLVDEAGSRSATRPAGRGERRAGDSEPCPGAEGQELKWPDYRLFEAERQLTLGVEWV